MSSRESRIIYVGNLPGDIREREIEDLFYKYGHILDVDLKIPPRPPGYAFVEFDDARDADDAIRGRDGYNFDGHRLRVELAHGGRGHSSSHDRNSNYSVNRGISRRSDYRVLVTGLPPSASWQDLKDHMRRAGDVCFSQVFRDGGGTTGIVDYTNHEDMKYAIRKLDDSEFRNAFSKSYIRVREYDSKRSLSRSRSHSRSRSRSRSNGKIPSRNRSYSHSRSRSRSKSPKPKSARRSHSKSRSRSVSSRSRSRSGSKNSLPGSRARSRSPVTSPHEKIVGKSPKKQSPATRSRSSSRQNFGVERWSGGAFIGVFGGQKGKWEEWFGINGHDRAIQSCDVRWLIFCLRDVGFLCYWVRWIRLVETLDSTIRSLHLETVWQLKSWFEPSNNASGP